MCQAAATITGDNPEKILVAWLRRFYAYFTSKRFVAAIAKIPGDTGCREPILPAALDALRAK